MNPSQPTVTSLYPALIPYIWVMLGNLKAKGLIGTPLFRKTVYPKKNK
jgi:hypothetical protein